MKLDLRRVLVVDRRIEYILCHVDDHDTGTPRTRDVERLLYHTRDVAHILDEVVVLRDRRRNADDVRLLKRILAYVGIRNLSRNTDHRHGVHMRCCDARHEIRRTRSRSCKHDTNLARGSGIAVRRVRSPLLVARQDMRELHLIYLIVEREDSAARIAEHDLDALLLQTLQERPCTIHQQSNPS